MSPLLMGLLGVMLLPLFVANWRSSLLGLSCQGLLIGWAAYRLDPHLASPHTWLTLADLVLLRGFGAPLLLYRALRGKNRALHQQFFSPNLLTWTIALGLVLAAFNLAASLIPQDGDERALTSVATAGVLLAFLVLASQAGAFGQVVGALRLENGIALFELGEQQRHEHITLHIGQLALVLATLSLYLWLFRGLVETHEAHASTDEPTL
ncbi:MAG TPA: hypothetical protein VHB79_25135 [Polyangiaceae bacterium]|nr:hypothetical protein [Polyangiaceae bacterium]